MSGAMSSAKDPERKAGGGVAASVAEAGDSEPSKSAPWVYPRSALVSVVARA